MAKKTATERDLERLFEHKPEISQPGRLVPHLKHEIGGDRSISEIETALGRMEDRGAIKLGRSGKIITRVKVISETREPRDRCDASPGAKRNRMFAKGVPAYLTDEMCGPVVVRMRDGQVEVESTEPASSQELQSTDSTAVGSEALHEESEKVSVVQRSNGLPTVENLNLALMALRYKVDANGVLQENSAAKVIETALGCTKLQASDLNNLLGKMGARTTKPLGGGKYRTVLSPSFDEVTEALLSDARRPKNTPKPQAPSPEQVVHAKQSENAPEVATEAGDARSSEGVHGMSVDGAIHRLMEIVKRLEFERDELAQRLDNTTVERDDLLQRNQGLEEKLAEQQVVSPLVAEVLSRYAPS